MSSSSAWSEDKSHTRWIKARLPVSAVRRASFHRHRAWSPEQDATQHATPMATLRHTCCVTRPTSTPWSSACAADSALVVIASVTTAASHAAAPRRSATTRPARSRARYPWFNRATHTQWYSRHGEVAVVGAWVAANTARRHASVGAARTAPTRNARRVCMEQLPSELERPPDPDPDPDPALVPVPVPVLVPAWSPATPSMLSSVSRYRSDTTGSARGDALVGPAPPPVLLLLLLVCVSGADGMLGDSTGGGDGDEAPARACASVTRSASHRAAWRANAGPRHSPNATSTPNPAEELTAASNTSRENGGASTLVA